MSINIDGARQFLGVLIPRLGPVLNRVPELIQLFRDSFKAIGGTEDDVDAILAANQKNIDRLGNPDSFRHKPPVLPVDPPPPPPPPPPAAFPYNNKLTGTHPRIRNDARLLQSGDVIWRLGQQAMWWVYSAGDISRHVPPGAEPEWREEQTI